VLLATLEGARLIAGENG